MDGICSGEIRPTHPSGWADADLSRASQNFYSQAEEANPQSHTLHYWWMWCSQAESPGVISFPNLVSWTCELPDAKRRELYPLCITNSNPPGYQSSLCLFQSCSARHTLGHPVGTCQDSKAIFAMVWAPQVASCHVATSRWLLPPFSTCQLRHREPFSNTSWPCSLCIS